MKQLPQLDTAPEEWGPEHDELTFKRRELKEVIRLGNKQGVYVDPDDDTDNGLDIER